MSRHMELFAANTEVLPAAEVQARYPLSQKDFIRKIMVGADEAGTWLTLSQLEILTGYGQASISAQLRNLRKDGHHVSKKIRAKQGSNRLVWEYRLGIHPFKGAMPSEK